MKTTTELTQEQRLQRLEDMYKDLEEILTEILLSQLNNDYHDSISIEQFV